MSSLQQERLSDRVLLFQGKCEEVLPRLRENSIHALVCDPPAGINFMGSKWDSDKGGRHQWVSWMTGVMLEVYRVLRPGAHGLVWALPKTSHWTALALEEAGFEIRDCLYHLTGQGMPKSLDIPKALDAHFGEERPVVGKRKHPTLRDSSKCEEQASACHGGNTWSREWDITASVTREAKQWEGWGTALKPAAECWWLVRKPLSEKTVAENILKWGVGGLSIDGCRILTDEKLRGGSGVLWSHLRSGETASARCVANTKGGRHPAHLLLDEEAARLLDEHSGVLTSGVMRAGTQWSTDGGYHGSMPQTACLADTYGDSGGASRFFTQAGWGDEDTEEVRRFFYCAKAATSEKEMGLQGAVPCIHCGGIDSTEHTVREEKKKCRRNGHPTVKPLSLMRWLCRLITPPGGIVIDPFMGSGTTGCVTAEHESWKFIGIEEDEDSYRISRARICHWGGL